MEIYVDEKGEVAGVRWLGLRAGAVRFYGCNYRCPFCPAQRWSYSGSFGGVEFCMDEEGRVEVESTALAERMLAFLREHPEAECLLLTGGEPLPDRQRSEEVVDTILELDRLAEDEVLVVCRTNGHYLGRKGVPECFSRLRELEKLRVVFEIPVVGTTEEEFALLSGIESKYFNCQLASYWQLSPVAGGRVEVMASFGTGHSSGGVHLVHPETRESMFRREHWSRDFEDVYHDTCTKLGLPRMPAYCLSDKDPDAVYRCMALGCVGCRQECEGVRRALEKYGGEMRVESRDEYLEDYREFSELFEPAESCRVEI